MKFQTAYGEKTQKPKIECGPGLTEQSHVAECDVNNILKKFIRTGNIAHRNKNEPHYGDQTSADLHEALNIVTSANSMFMELPAETRAKFKNDAGTFLDFVQDEKNHQEMFELGLTENPPTLITEPEAPAQQNPEASPPETTQDSQGDATA